MSTDSTPSISFPSSSSFSSASLLFLSSLKTWKAFRKLEPLSVVVLTTLFLMPYSVGMSLSAVDKTSKLSASYRAADRLVRSVEFTQWAVTPRKLLLLTDQQSVVVAMWSTLLISSVNTFFIDFAKSSILDRRVTREMTLAVGRRSVRSSLKASFSTVDNGWRLLTTYLTMALSSALWDMDRVASNVVCLRVEVPASEALFLFCEVSCSYFFRCCGCALWKTQN